MAERHDLPKIKPAGEPTIFNHEMGKWGILTGLGAGIAAFIVQAKKPLTRGTMLLIAGTEVAGAMLGGIAGKNKQEREMTEGRVVKTPGFWNKGILSGLLASGLIQLPFNLSDKALRDYNADTMSKGRIWAGAALTLGGMAVGSIHRKNELQRDFDRALTVRDLQTDALRTQIMAQQVANGTPGYMNSVNAAEAAELMAKQEHHSSHADKAKHGVADLELAEAAR